MITAGPTFEKIDPVRFIGNHSSGKMGFAIAEELANRGANVKLVAGPVKQQINHPNISRIDIQTANEMYEQSVALFPECDGAVMCAAVADFTPVVKVDKKVKRGKENYSIELKPTKDIAAALGQQKKDTQLLVGFALETNDEHQNAQKKLEKKNLDFIVLNSLNDKGAGFGVDTNKICIIDRQNKQTDFELKTKSLVAVDIVNRIIEEINRLSD